MAPRFKIDISIHVYNFQNFVTLREEKKTKLPEMKVWMIKKVRRFFSITMIWWSVSNV